MRGPDPYANRTEAEPVADKLTNVIVEALTRAAAGPGGLPLYASKSDPGLFPNTSAAKPAVQKCLADDLLRVTGSDPKSKSPRDLYALTEKGWEFLLAAVNPKQVLEDFVRVLEARQGEVGELLATARRMAESLQGLREAVAKVLPVVSEARVQRPTPLTPLPAGRGELALACVTGASEGEHLASSEISPSLQGGGWGGVSPPTSPPRSSRTWPTIAGRRTARCRNSSAPSRPPGPRPASARSTTACANCTPTARWRCTPGPARSTPCRSRSTPCSSATALPITLR
jgi:hypothetical protein